MPKNPDTLETTAEPVETGEKLRENRRQRLEVKKAATERRRNLVTGVLLLGLLDAIQPAKGAKAVEEDSGEPKEKGGFWDKAMGLFGKRRSSTEAQAAVPASVVPSDAAPVQASPQESGVITHHEKVHEKREKPTGFFLQALECAKTVEAKYGVPIAVTMGMACLESNNGKSRLARKNNNFFGMRPGGTWAKYKSMKASFDAYGKLLKNSTIYSGVLDKKNPREILLALAPRYCPDLASELYIERVEGRLKSFGWSLEGPRVISEHHENAELLAPDAPVFSFLNGGVAPRVTDVPRYRDKHPVDGKGHRHKGMDFAMPEGAPIVATRSLRVVESRYQSFLSAGKRMGAGNYVIVELPDGKLASFMHLQSPGPGVGTLLQAGEVLGFVGKTGGATGPHLHFQVETPGRSVVEDLSPYLDSTLKQGFDAARRARGL